MSQLLNNVTLSSFYGAKFGIDPDVCRLFFRSLLKEGNLQVFMNELTTSRDAIIKRYEDGVEDLDSNVEIEYTKLHLKMSFKAVSQYVAKRKMEATKIVPTFVAKREKMCEVPQVIVQSHVPIVIINETEITIAEMGRELSQDYKDNGIELKIEDDITKSFSKECHNVAEDNMPEDPINTGINGTTITPNHLLKMQGVFEKGLNNINIGIPHFKSLSSNDMQITFRLKNTVESVQLPKVLKNFLTPGNYLSPKDISYSIINETQVKTFDDDAQIGLAEFKEWLKTKDDEKRSCAVKEPWIDHIEDVSFIRFFGLYFIGGDYPWLILRRESEIEIPWPLVKIKRYMNFIKKCAIMYGLNLRNKFDNKKYFEILLKTLKLDPVSTVDLLKNIGIWQKRRRISTPLTYSPDKFYIEDIRVDVSQFTDENIDDILDHLETINLDGQVFVDKKQKDQQVLEQQESDKILSIFDDPPEQDQNKQVEEEQAISDDEDVVDETKELHDDDIEQQKEVPKQKGVKTSVKKKR